jgi:hypothetical protein
MARRILLTAGLVSVALLTLLVLINFVYAQESGRERRGDCVGHRLHLSGAVEERRQRCDRRL